MEVNPYKAPEAADTRSPPGVDDEYPYASKPVEIDPSAVRYEGESTGEARMFWKFLCLASVGATLLSMGCQLIIAIAFQRTGGAMLALIQLLSMTMIGIAGIGWVLSPRGPTV